MPAQAALLVIDVQRAMCEGEYACFETDAMIERINGLVDKAHRAGAPVVFIQHESRDGILDRGSEGWELATGLAVGADDVVLPKTSPDSFLRTGLQSLLEDHGTRTLVICGLQSEYCVDTTTRRALALGYPVTLVSDAHSTLDNEHLSANQIIRHHTLTLSSISSFGPRVTPLASAEVAF